jgi:ribosome-associated protein
VAAVPDSAGDEVLAWVREAARAADEKLGTDTVVLEVGAVLAVTGWFVITSGANPRQVKAIAEHIEEQVAAIGGPRPRSVEGMQGREWVLLDYGDFVVHVFERSQREHYDLERLWKDVPVVPWQ